MRLKGFITVGSVSENEEDPTVLQRPCQTHQFVGLDTKSLLSAQRGKANCGLKSNARVTEGFSDVFTLEELQAFGSCINERFSAGGKGQDSRRHATKFASELREIS